MAKSRYLEVVIIRLRVAARQKYKRGTSEAVLTNERQNTESRWIQSEVSIHQGRAVIESSYRYRLFRYLDIGFRTCFSIA